MDVINYKKMADTIVEITERTHNEYGPGMHTRLFFARVVEPEKGKKCNSLEVDTCIVPGNKDVPYETGVFGEPANSIQRNFFSKRSAVEEYIKEHLKSVDELKEQYLNNQI